MWSNLHTLFVYTGLSFARSFGLLMGILFSKSNLIKSPYIYIYIYIYIKFQTWIGHIVIAGEKKQKVDYKQKRLSTWKNKNLKKKKGFYISSNIRLHSHTCSCNIIFLHSLININYFSSKTSRYLDKLINDIRKLYKNLKSIQYQKSSRAHICSLDNLKMEKYLSGAFLIE
jgi:hypothetical protein